MMSALRNWCWALVIAPLWCACGGSSADGETRVTQPDSGVPGTDAGTPELPDSKAEFAERATEIYCGNLQKCCGDLGAFAMSGCRSQSLADSSAIILDPLVQYDRSAAADCLATIDATTRDCRLGSFAFEVQWAPCNRAFLGTVNRGGPCIDTRECAPIENGQVHCGTDYGANASSNGKVCLHALPPLRGTLGQACDCTVVGISKCLKTWNATGPLDELAACYAEDGLYCDTKKGACSALAELDQPCALYYPSCRSGLFCGDDEFCVPAPHEGDSCEQRMAVCETNLRCYDGRCARLPTLGEPCEFITDHRCAEGSHCSSLSNTCVPPEPVGAGCWSDTDCISGHCDIGPDGGFAGVCIANALNDTICADISGGYLE